MDTKCKEFKNSFYDFVGWLVGFYSISTFTGYLLAHSVYIYIYIYIYSHPQTDCFIRSELFSVAGHAGRSKPRSKPVQLYVRLYYRPLGHQADHVGKGNFKVFLFLETAAAAAFVYIFFIPYRLPECSILSKSFALR